MDTINQEPKVRIPWNKGKLTGQKPALKLKEVKYGIFEFIFKCQSE